MPKATGFLVTQDPVAFFFLTLYPGTAQGRDRYSLPF